MILSDMFEDYVISEEHIYGVFVWVTRVPVVATFPTEFQLINGYVDILEKASENGIRVLPYKRVKSNMRVMDDICRGVENGSLVHLVRQIRDGKIVHVANERKLPLAG